MGITKDNWNKCVRTAKERLAKDASSTDAHAIAMTTAIAFYDAGGFDGLAALEENLNDIKAKATVTGPTDQERTDATHTVIMHDVIPFMLMTAFFGIAGYPVWCVAFAVITVAFCALALSMLKARNIEVNRTVTLAIPGASQFDATEFCDIAIGEVDRVRRSHELPAPRE